MINKNARLEKLRKLTRPENQPVVVLWLDKDGGHYTLGADDITEAEIKERFGDNFSVVEVAYVDVPLP